MRREHIERTVMVNLPPNRNQEETEPLRNDKALQENGHENLGNGTASRDHRKHVTVPACCSENWKLIAICSLVSLLSLGVGIAIGTHIHTNDQGRNDSVVTDDWIYYKRHHYFFSVERRNWTSSIQYCEEHRAVLAVLENSDIKENVKRFKEYSDEHWCGGYMENGEQKWLNKTLGENDRLKNISGSNCTTWNPDALLSRDCAEKKSFICIKFPAQQVSIT